MPPPRGKSRAPTIVQGGCSGVIDGWQLPQKRHLRGNRQAGAALLSVVQQTTSCCRSYRRPAGPAHWPKCMARPAHRNRKKDFSSWAQGRIPHCRPSGCRAEHPAMNFPRGAPAPPGGQLPHPPRTFFEMSSLDSFQDGTRGTFSPGSSRCGDVRRQEAGYRT